MLEASIFSTSAKATLNHSRHARALLAIELNVGSLLDLIPERASPQSCAPVIAEICEQLAVAMRTAESGSSWSRNWNLYCHWQQVLSEIVVELVATARAAGFEPEVDADTALGRAVALEYALTEEPWS